MGCRIIQVAVPDTDRFTLRLPKGSKILTLQKNKKNEPRLFILRSEGTVSIEERNFILVPTGSFINEMAEELKYVGTFLSEGGRFNGPFFYHIFEIK